MRLCSLYFDIVENKLKPIIEINEELQEDCKGYERKIQIVSDMLFDIFENAIRNSNND